MSTLKGQVQHRCPVRWLDHGRQAIVTLPAHVGLSTSGPVREQLLTLINRGAETLIADMSATVSCDHAGTDTLARVYQRAAASGTELRLVVTAPVIRRVLAVSGLDRLVSIYPALDAALAAHGRAVVLPLVARAARTGAADAAVRQTAGTVIKLPVAGLPDSQATAITPAVPAAVPDPAASAAAAERPLEEMLCRIASSIFEVGMVLSAASGTTPGSAEKQIGEAIRLLDDLVRKIYDAALRDRAAPTWPGGPR